MRNDFITSCLDWLRLSMLPSLSDMQAYCQLRLTLASDSCAPHLLGPSCCSHGNVLDLMDMVGGTRVHTTRNGTDVPAATADSTHLLPWLPPLPVQDSVCHPLLLLQPWLVLRLLCYPWRWLARLPWLWLCCPWQETGLGRGLAEVPSRSTRFGRDDLTNINKITLITIILLVPCLSGAVREICSVQVHMAGNMLSAVVGA